MKTIVLLHGWGMNPAVFGELATHLARDHSLCTPALPGYGASSPCDPYTLDEIVRDKLNQQLLELWNRTAKTVVFVTHSIPEAVFLSTKIVVMSPRPGRIIDTIDTNFPHDRTLDIRETPDFLKVAHRVREGLRAGHSYDD